VDEAGSDQGTAGWEPDIDAQGVDRGQIRSMLALTPEERLRRMQEYVESVSAIRGLLPATRAEVGRRS
jgi:hypothetical protein